MDNRRRKDVKASREERKRIEKKIRRMGLSPSNQNSYLCYVTSEYNTTE